MGNWLVRHATARAIIVVIAVYVTALVAMEIAQRPIRSAAPGVGTLDLTFGYEHATVLEVLGTYGESGRRAYGWFLVADSLMPIAFAVAGLLLIARLAPRWLPLLGAAPVAFMLLDLVENAAFMVMLAQFPDVGTHLVAFTRPVTMTKLLSFAVAMPTLLVAFVVFVTTWFRGTVVRPQTPA